MAADGVGRNGLYTGALLEQMNNQSQPIEQIIKKVVSQVKAGSNSQQEPWMEGSIEGEFCFGECGIQVAKNGVSDDRALWESVKDSRDIIDLTAYLNKFPQGLFAEVAQNRILANRAVTPTVITSQSVEPDAPKPILKFGNVSFEKVEGYLEVSAIDARNSNTHTSLRVGDRIVGCFNTYSDAGSSRVYRVEDLVKCNIRNRDPKTPLPTTQYIYRILRLSEENIGSIIL